MIIIIILYFINFASFERLKDTAPLVIAMGIPVTFSWVVAEGSCQEKGYYRLFGELTTRVIIYAYTAKADY